MSKVNDQTNFPQSETRLPIKQNAAAIESTNETSNDTKGTKTTPQKRSDAYRVAFYGSQKEKEAYRQNIRSQLKEQVREKDDLQRQHLIDRVAESDKAVASDRMSKQEDDAMRKKKAEYLKQFSNGNKKIMEEKEISSRRVKEADVELERKLLNMNPINWNMTLH
ncbi:uncharacterized protein LOC124434867 isoform X1 [Xenia sp. Carnegie-2017]|uniref:uncharacterized protein LOC124434236 isoform X2 n=2 Tax=Xenia sp. Carnegie-2017 TaxID=2897299 RepID=UPI001F03CC8E|nr:uncharacterized protein LOC124434236 isoform X2 [Xenia sp. Carnegie-2017]XP_046840749.1 uncharacterized protein LOC124434867 isoform X1 [Xenia sp. Carnegie-2017]XP_046840750.1 uncharacterized protein LOC124434867 isoform X1 [Xenia sp. Carnegie-2017]